MGSRVPGRVAQELVFKAPGFGVADEVPSLQEWALAQSTLEVGGASEFASLANVEDGFEAGGNFLVRQIKTEGSNRN